MLTTRYSADYWNLLVRIASVLITAALVTLIDGYIAWYSIVVSLGFTHYLLAFIYSKKQVSEFLRQQTFWISFSSLAILTALLYLTDFSLVLFFGLHHALNEGYLAAGKALAGARGKQLRFIRALLHLFLYLVVLRSTPDLRAIPTELLVAGLLACYVAFFHQLYRDGPTLTLREKLRYGGFEVAALGIVILSFYVNVTFLQFVAYHFVLWSLLPLRSLASRGAADMLQYGAVSVLVLGLFLMLTPLGLMAYAIDGSLLLEQFLFWSYVHISASFALSNAHPAWILRLFRPGTEGIRI